ncbi:MAG: DUF308 domain-containing protein [Erysipelotrichaceae bacterium]|nr:DUF308 domain-containing protein [Erysipelotrichaceae bacterium]
MKNIKWSSIALAALYIVSGIFLIANPEIKENEISLIIGVVAILVGVFNIIRYFIYPLEKRVFRNDFLFGLLFVSVGAVALIFKNMFLELVYIILAFVIMFSGFVKIQDGVDASHLGGKNAMIYFILAIISIGFGLLVLVKTYNFRVGSSITSIDKLLGYGLCYSGVSDLFSAIYLSGKLNSYINLKFKQLEDNREKEAPKKIEPLEQAQEEIKNNVTSINDDSNVVG